jgi:hypothetical protein
MIAVLGSGLSHPQHDAPNLGSVRLTPADKAPMYLWGHYKNLHHLTGRTSLRIPMKPDAYSKVKPDIYSVFIPDSVPI